MTLSLTDNMRGDQHRSLAELVTYPPDMVADKRKESLENLEKALSRYSHQPLKELAADHPGLIVYPPDASIYCDDVEENWLYGCERGKIETGNLMGAFGIGGHDIRIRSRFDEEENRPYFMYYLLQKVMGLNVLDLPSRTSSDPVRELCVFLFPALLKRALSKGVFKAYRRFEYNDDKIKGAVDVSRHLRLNVPFHGAVAYATREYTVDNPLVQLVRHAIEFIKVGPFREILTRGDREVKEAVEVIVAATPTYVRQERVRIIGQNLRLVRHPYFSEYTLLQKISLQILRHEKVSHGAEQDELQGIVFDGAWLWEEYLSTVLHGCAKLAGGDLCHPRNKTRQNPIHIYSSRNDKSGTRKPIYPDFLWRSANLGKGSQEYDAVLDAKYKRAYYRGDDGKEHFGVQREDRYQMISYMYLTTAKKGVFLCPMSSKEKSNADCEANGDDGADFEMVKNSESYIEGGLLGYPGDIAVVPFVVPDAKKSFKDYCESMNKSEMAFCKNLLAVMNRSGSGG